MPKIVFAHTADSGSVGSAGGDSAKPGGWDPVFTQEDDGKAPSLSPINPNKSDAIVLKPKKAKTRTPEGLHRDFIDQELGTGAPAKVAVGMGEQSESDHEYKYAPGLTPMAALIFAGPSFKAWIDPTGEVLDFEPWMEHPDVLEVFKKAGYTWDEGAKEDPVEALVAAGWTRVGVDHDQLYIQPGVGKKIDWVLSKLPVKALMVSSLVVEPDSIDSDESSTTIEVDEGEDAQTAWKKRNSVRKRVKAELAETYQERQSNVSPQAPPGYPDRIEDSNSTPARPGRRGDKNVQLDRLPGDKSYPSGSPEPPDGSDIGVGNMVYPLDGILFIKGGEFKEVVEDPENFLRHTYIWTSEPNRLPSSVLVQVADLNEPGSTEEQPSMTLAIGPDGQWAMDKEASRNWIPRPPTHEHPEADFPQERMPVAYESAVQHLPKVLKDVSAKVMKKLGQQQAGEEKDDAPKGKSYNVLEDPALDLAPGITPEEKIFTTIQDWDGDTFYGDVAKLDKATLAILQEHPKSNQRKHKYFRWDYISQADLDKGAAKDIKELGYTVGNEPALIVERLPAWKKIEDQVKQARKEKVAS